MKNLFFILLAMMTISLAAQESATYAMYSNIYITPERGKMMDLSKAMSYHNKTYHNAAPLQATVYRVRSGPNMGKLLLSSGPHTWADIDNRKVDNAHDADWRDNIMPHIKEIQDGGNWRLAVSQSYIPEGVQFSKLRFRFHDVESQKDYRYNALMKNMAEAHKSAYPNLARAVFNRVGATADGRERVVVFGYQKWQEMDNTPMSGPYNSAFGNGSWDDFIDEISGLIMRTEDELVERDSDMSGGPN